MHRTRARRSAAATAPCYGSSAAISPSRGTSKSWVSVCDRLPPHTPSLSFFASFDARKMSPIFSLFHLRERVRVRALARSELHCGARYTVGSSKSRVAHAIEISTGGAPVILIAVLRSAYQSSPESGKIDRGVFEYAQPGQSTPPARTSDTRVSSAPAQDPDVTRVYECREDGQLVYSGQPCGRDSITRDVDVRDTNTHTPPTLRRDGECADIQKEIDQINARMRQAYSPAEGEQLRERRRTMSDRLHVLKCGR